MMRFKCLLIVVLLVSCSSDSGYVPKPYAYPRIHLPEHAYILFDSAHCPYVFEIPVYARMEKNFQGEYSTPHPTWYNMNFTGLNATLHITHYPFTTWAYYDSLVDDTRKLVFKHLQRADDIVEHSISEYNPELKGLLFDIEGNTATNLNFYITDSSRNFFRGALYFNQQTKADSIAPVYRFLKEDVLHLIKTFKWKQ